MSLSDKARELARPETSAPVRERPATDGDGKERPETFNNVQDRSEPLPDLDIPAPPDDGPEQVPVLVAWRRVRADVRTVAKLDSGQGINYNFRGIDRALNAYGPITLRHGIDVLPVHIDMEHQDRRTKGGSSARECTMIVTYRIYGPTGDHIEVQAAGEAMDHSDKATSQAQSVALRNLLFLGGLIPTGEPNADGTHLERGEAPVRTPASYRDEALDLGTSRERMRQIVFELRQHNLYGATVVNEVGDDEAVGELVMRLGKERFPKGGE